MVLEQVDNLLREGLIDEWMYHTYVTFMADEFSQGYLQNSIDSIFMEKPPAVGEFGFSYYAGRLSVWREIRECIVGINNLLKGLNYDGSSKRTEE